MEEPTYKPFSVRPQQALRRKLHALSGILGKSEGMLAVDCIEAVVEMIERGDLVPAMVQRARIIRESIKEVSDTALLGGGIIRTARSELEITASESVRRLAPTLRFLPLLAEFPHFSELANKHRVFLTREQIGIPFAKATGAQFGIIISTPTDNLSARIPPSLGLRPGTILLFGEPDFVLPALRERAERKRMSFPDCKDGTDLLLRNLRPVVGWHGNQLFFGEINPPSPGEEQLYVDDLLEGGSAKRYPLDECKGLHLYVGTISPPDPLIVEQTDGVSDH